MTGTLAGFVPPTVAPALTYDGTNRLTSRGGNSISYDANGNITSFGAATYTWNARNQLTATSSGGATFGYDAEGRRISSTVSGVTTPYLFDGQNPAMIASNLLLAGEGLDEIYAQINSSGTTSFLRDGMNSTVAVTNGSAATTANYAYSSYGDSVGAGLAATPLQYTGRENDGATGLYYFRARYYSPQLDRFISEDPIGSAGGTNYYAYADGNPISESDPLGLWGTKAHNKIIKEMFPGLNPILLAAIEQGSLSVDSLDNQGPSGAYQHAMRAPGETIADAQEKMCKFVSDNMAGYNGGNQRNIKDPILAYRALGRALHPIMDSTSPAHSGWQIWYNPVLHPSETIAHGDAHGSIEGVDALTPALLQETLNRMRSVMAGGDGGMCGCGNQ